MDLILIVLLVSFIVWLLSQFLPMHGHVGKISFIVWASCVTLLLAGARIVLD